MFLHEVATREINESEEINIALIVECFNQEIYVHDWQDISRLCMKSKSLKRNLSFKNYNAWRKKTLIVQ